MLTAITPSSLLLNLSLSNQSHTPSIPLIRKENQMSINLDKLKIKIFPEHYQYSEKHKKSSAIGANFFINSTKELIITISGKFMSNPYSLGYINKENFTQMLDKIYMKFGISITPDIFLNKAIVLSVDVTKDIKVEKSTSNYISTLNEIISPNTRKKQILIFEKDLGYKESILVKPMTITTKTSFSAYSKYRELVARRNENPDYFNQFSPDFLESCKKLLRFECRFTKFKEIRKAFNLAEGSEIHPKDILFSDINIIYNNLNELTGGAV